MMSMIGPLTETRGSSCVLWEAGVVGNVRRLPAYTFWPVKGDGDPVYVRRHAQLDLVRAGGRRVGWIIAPPRPPAPLSS